MTDPTSTARSQPSGGLVGPGAAWITHPDWAEPAVELTRSPVLRRRFVLPAAPTTARLVIAGLGVWTATLDGVPVDDAVLEPGSTEYRTRVAVAEIDLTGRLAPGPHELVVELGEGPAHVREPIGRYTKFVGCRFAPRLLAELTATDATGEVTVLGTDTNWQATLGRTTTSHWYGGEDLDARLAPSDWVPAHVLGDRDSAGPALWRREAPPVRVVASWAPVAREPSGDGGLLLDFGVNHAGRPVLEVTDRVPAGTRIELWPAENTDGTGHVDQTSCGQPIYDSYVAAGGPDRWHPRFCYHGYRFVEVRTDGPPGVLDHVEVTTEQLRSDNPRTGTFASSHPTLDRIYALTERAVESNLFSVLTDCPHREKLGWLEQLHLVFPTLAHHFDVSGQLSDMVTHMVDAQTAEGLVPDVAPELTVFGGGFRDDVNWGSAVVQLPALLWRTYGDLGPARRAWPAVQRYLDHVDSRTDDGLLPHGLADWKTLDPSTPATLVHGHGQLRMLDTTAELATALGADPQPYRDRAAQLRRRLSTEHVRPDGSAGSGSQASYALALDVGLVPPERRAAALAAFVGRLADDDHQVSVGEIGLPALFRVLAEADRHDVLLELVTQDRGPGYAHMIATGCTALAETWEVIQGEASANHFMLGYVVTWFTESLAGLRQAPTSVGWRSAVVAPQGFDLLDHASVAYDSPAGRYAVDWSWEDDRRSVRLDVVVPAGATAEVRPPAGFHGGPEAPGGPDLLEPGRHRVRIERDRDRPG